MSTESNSITGKITKVKDPVTKGEYTDHYFMIQQPGEHGKPAWFNARQKVSPQLETISLGTEVTAYFNLNSREYEGKIYHNVDCWKLEVK